MTVDLASACWPDERLRDLVETLLRRSDLPIVASRIPAEGRANDIPRLAWLTSAPVAMGLETTLESPSWAELTDVLHRRGPCLVLANRGRPVQLAVLRERNRCRLLCPDGTELSASVDDVVTWLVSTSNAGAKLAPLFNGLTDGPRKVARLLATERMAGDDCLVVEYALDAAHTVAAQVAQLSGWRSLVYYAVTALGAAFALGLATWSLGSAAVDGRVNLGRIVAWTVLSLTMVVLKYMSANSLGTFSLAMAAVVKKRLLEGAFFIEHERIRKLGIGALLARLNEASIIERGGVDEAVGVLFPMGVLAGAAYAFANGAYPVSMCAALALTCVLLIVVVTVMQTSFAESYAARLGLTESLVDKLLGHRTRINQENPALHHEGEDDELADYVRKAARQDTLATILSSYGRVWFFFGSMVVLFAFVQAISPTQILFTAGGILLSESALAELGGIASRVTAWRSAWGSVGDLVRAGRTRERPQRDATVEVSDSSLPTVVSVSSVAFRYSDAGRTILTNATLGVQQGDRLLLEGPSGGGKTTFLKLLAGEIRPTGGTILVNGVDFHSVSEAEWRQRVASAPQFHENYIFSNTFLFNIDPHAFGPVVRAEGEKICAELGLDTLVAKMPSGTAQLLGETGWQLSHGERSRVFIARALLQGADVLVFDESFGALDPFTLRLAIDCVRAHAKTLIVVAHV
jgi:ATP-binding cassette subfamily B protein